MTDKSKFCRVFELPQAQVVYLLGTNQDGEPSVEMRTHAKGIFLKMEPGWSNDDEGWKLAEHFFMSRTQETAEVFYAAALEMVTESRSHGA